MIRNALANCVISVITILGLTSGTSRTAAGEPDPYECRRADGAITIDGRAEEPAWKNASVLGDFGLPWLGERARPPRTRTTARLLWDDKFLYFFAEMDDADLYADILEQDGMTWENDVFELFFKPALDQPAYYEFQVNAAGTVFEMLVPRRRAGGYRRFARDGKFHVEQKVVLRGTLNDWSDRDTGWSVEGKLPWTDFARTGGGPKAGDQWTFTLCRYDYSVDFEGPELSATAPLKAADFHRFEDYAPLRFVETGNTR